MIDRHAVMDAVSRIAYNGHHVMAMDHPVSGLLLDLSMSVMNKDLSDREYMWLATQVLVMAFAHPNDPDHDIRIITESVEQKS